MKMVKIFAPEEVNNFNKGKIIIKNKAGTCSKNKSHAKQIVSNMQQSIENGIFFK
jgi:hypothetical protein